MTTANILLVDDDRSLLTTLAENLKLEGYTVAEAESAERAIELAAGTEFHVVITDIRMKGMDGVELFHSLRGMGMHMPVVLMTGFAIEAAVEGAVASGAFAVLVKPFDIALLLKTIADALRGPPSARPGR